MPCGLAIICGHPCSGKSGVAQHLAGVLREQGQEAQVVGEEALHLERSESYKDVPSEKSTRGLLRSAVDRALTGQKMVIVDSLNNIKGYRYELWCLARQAGTRYCMIHVDTPADTCRQWNAARQSSTYSSAVFDDLAGRFERPDSRSRWDQPLFTVSPLLGEAHVRQQLEGAAASLAGNAAAAAAASGGQWGLGKELKPNLATDTTTTSLSSTNLQYEIDRAAQEVVERVWEAQAAAGSGAPGWVVLEEGEPPLDLQRAVLLPELRRHKRAFMKLTTNQTTMRTGVGGAAARRMFVDYLRHQLVQ